MTRSKGRKRLVRQRTAKTGESYTAALRQLRATKERSVSTTTEQPRRTANCAVCQAEDDGTASFIVAGATFCEACHVRLTAAVRTPLEPEIARTRRPIDFFVSSLVFVPDGDHLVVHLHTLQPGLVIGAQGQAADRIRSALVGITGDAGLRLNIVPHDPLGRDVAGKS
jgi:hypothetical protein